MPSTLRPVASAEVFSFSWPAAGPETSIGVVPVHLAAFDDLPAPAIAADLDDAEPMRGKLDLALPLVGARPRFAPFPDAGEHEVGVRVFVIDGQQPVRAVARPVWQRVIADEVVVVAELALLAGDGEVRRVEGRRVDDDPVAPAEQHLDVVSLRDVVALVEIDLELPEAERRRAGGPGRGNRRRRHGRARDEALQGLSAGKPCLDDLADRALARRVDADVFVVVPHGAAPLVERTLASRCDRQMSALIGAGSRKHGFEVVAVDPRPQQLEARDADEGSLVGYLQAIAAAAEADDMGTHRRAGRPVTELRRTREFVVRLQRRPARRMHLQRADQAVAAINRDRRHRGAG
jgi:hypothetical protein